MTNSNIDDKPFTVQVGHRYNRRCRDVSGIIKANSMGLLYDARNSSLTYRADGRSTSSFNNKENYDLISEYKEPTAEPQDEWGPWIGWNGGECPVDGSTVVQTMFDDGSGSTNEADIWEWEKWGSYPIAYRIKKEPEVREYKLQLNTEHDWIEDFSTIDEHRGIIITIQGNNISIKWAEGE